MKGSVNSGCPVTTALAVIGGKWKVLILHRLREGALRFGQLQKSVTGVSQKMLSQELRSLEGDGLISRQVYAEVPPRVEYALTPLGESLEPVLRELGSWGLRFQDLRQKAKGPGLGEAV